MTEDFQILAARRDAEGFVSFMLWLATGKTYRIEVQELNSREMNAYRYAQAAMKIRNRIDAWIFGDDADLFWESTPWLEKDYRLAEYGWTLLEYARQIPGGVRAAA